jgi:hypothetical protein
LRCSSARSSPPRPTTLRPFASAVTTRLVEVNVIVRDKNGPVAGLTKDDFTLFDRKKQQKIATFAVTAMNWSQPPPAPLRPGLYQSSRISPGRSDHRDHRFTRRPEHTIQDQLYAKQQFIKIPGRRCGQTIASRVYLLGPSCAC